MRDEIIRKLTSRKLWVAVAGFVSLLLVALGRTEGEAAQVTALIMAGASVVAYIVGEGLIDASNKDETESNIRRYGYAEPLTPDETEYKPTATDDEYELTPDEPFIDR